MLDHYATLGLNTLSATDREIKKAFRKLAIKWHPDKCSDNNASEMFTTISTAYNTLIDKDLKRKYDRELRLHLRAQARSSKPSGFRSHGVGFDQRKQSYRSKESSNKTSNLQFRFKFRWKEIKIVLLLHKNNFVTVFMCRKKFMRNLYV